jgi:hypothetical protein
MVCRALEPFGEGVADLLMRGGARLGSGFSWFNRRPRSSSVNSGDGSDVDFVVESSMADDAGDGLVVWMNHTEAAILLRCRIFIST